MLTEATVALVRPPAAKALAVLGYADESAAAEAAHTLLPYRPLTVEGMAADLVGSVAGLPKGGAWLFVEMGGDEPAEALAHAEKLCRDAGTATTDHTVVTDPARQRALWRVREDASGTATRMPDGSEAWPGWEDCAVPPARLGPYLRDFRSLLAQHGLRGTPYGHFGDGCIHVRIDFDLLTAPGIRRFREFSGDLAELVVAHGGSLSGEHGDGQARAELLPKMYGPELVGLFGRFKDLWDPAGGLNPGMLVRPDRMDDNLRFAPLPKRPVDVEFGYPHDGGDFSAAVRRCVGVAKCRNAAPSASAVMCPSYRATGEERHSTRGRARLLHEMLAGEVVTDGWRSEEVRDALDLCLSCKGCRSDCPVGVDMATYKAEFLHHHYAGRLRPAAHYSMGRLPRWLHAAAPVASLLNALARTPLAGAAKRLGGIAPQRAIPEVATEPFVRWWAKRSPAPAPGGPALLLWPDTFTNYLAPEAGRAAVRVLEAAGLSVRLPPAQRRRPPVLRPDLRLDRPARPSARGHAPYGERPRPAPHGRHPADRPRTELRGGPAHRPARAAARRPARGTAGRLRTHLRADPGGAGAHLGTAAPRPPGRRPDPLPPARRPGRGGRTAPARTGRAGGRPERRLLRSGRKLRLRTRPLRRVRGLRGRTAPAVRTGGRPARKSWRTASPAAPRSPSSPTGEPVIWPKYWLKRCRAGGEAGRHGLSPNTSCASATRSGTAGCPGPARRTRCTGTAGAPRSGTYRTPWCGCMSAVAEEVTPKQRPAAMAASQSSVLVIGTVPAGRASAGHWSGVVTPETVFSARVRPARSARISERRRASGSSAGRAATRGSVPSRSASRPSSWRSPRSRAASTSPRSRPAVRSSIRRSSSAVPGCRSCQRRSRGVVYGPAADQAWPRSSGRVPGGCGPGRRRRR
ncbi:hypothetical protein SRIMM317S_06067 [Streptomyces rimosus subsp. rimosus]